MIPSPSMGHTAHRSYPPSPPRRNPVESTSTCTPYPLARVSVPNRIDEVHQTPRTGVNEPFHPSPFSEYHSNSPRSSSRVSVHALTGVFGPSTPVSISAATAAAGLVALNGTRSRKSSCDLCHHRKIKCDQTRPACASCLRKHQLCHYSEETEQNNPQINLNRHHRRANTVTIVSATDPAQRVILPVPDRNLLRKGGSRRTSSLSGSAESVLVGGETMQKGRRERITAGFDSESENEVVKAEIVERGEGPIRDEAEELDSGNERDKSGSVGSSEKKRTAGLDDDVSGELLELASGSTGQKKSRTANPVLATTSSSRRAKSSPHRSVHGPRSSLSASLSHAPLTPSTTTPPIQTRLDSYSTPLQALLASMPSPETQAILFATVSSDPFLTEGVSLLQPQFQLDFRGLLERRHTRFREGDATTLANAFAFLAVALRILPKETSDLLLASVPSPAATSPWASIAQPRSLPHIISALPPSAIDPTPLDQRYLDLALLATQVAEQADAPSIMLVMLKLVLYRYCMIRRDRSVLASGWLAQAVKVAQALGMSKEWEGLPQGERELRRRVMWTLYIADRHHSFETSYPYTILDAHQGIHLPSPCSETDLYTHRGEHLHLPSHSTEHGPTACTALFIHTHLARRITPILDSFATVSPVNTPRELLLRFDASLDQFQDALPCYLRLFPLTDTHFDSTHPYLAPHRIRLHSVLLAYRSGVHRAHLTTYLLPTTPPAIRQVIAQVCLSTLRVQRSAKMLDAKVARRLFNPPTIFESASTLALIMHVEKANLKGSNADHLSLRVGVAEGIELLDNVLNLQEAVYARKAVHVLRELVVRVEAKLPIVEAQGGDDPNGKKILKSASPGHPPTPPGTSEVDAITAWLDDLRKGGVNMEYVLRDPEWIGGWERVVAGM